MNGVVTQEAVEMVEADINSFTSPGESELIGVYMDVSDWEFVIRTLRQEGVRAMSADTRERAEFTADSIQDVLDGPR